MPMKDGIRSGSEVEVVVESMAFTGRGVGRVGDLVVFVAGGIPGDRLKARVIRRKRRFIESMATEIIEPSPDRIDPPCRHFEHCGGCSFQSVSYSRQLEYKEGFVRDALVRIGGIGDPPLDPILPCEDQFYYRNKMEFTFLPLDSQPARLGLHVRGSWSSVFDVEECLLQSDLSNSIVRKVRGVVHRLNIPAYHISEHHGFIRFLVIRDNKKTGNVLINIVTNEGDFPEQDELLRELRSGFPQIVAIYRTINSTPANVASGDAEELLWSSESFFESIGQYRFLVTPTTFLQTNSRQAEVLYDQVLNIAQLSGEGKVLDLYCGCGTISHLVSPQARSVLGVELDPAAVRMAAENARINDVGNCRFEAADAARYLAGLSGQDTDFDCAIVDPPRAGMGAKAVRRLARLRPPVIIYVSCNPSTLARDLELFGQLGYRLIRVVPVDMFPHTYHVESVSRLERS